MSAEVISMEEFNLDARKPRKISDCSDELIGEWNKWAFYHAYDLVVLAENTIKAVFLMRHITLSLLLHCEDIGKEELEVLKDQLRSSVETGIESFEDENICPHCSEE